MQHFKANAKWALSAIGYILVYAIAAALNGSPNPLQWGGRSITVFVLALFLFGSLAVAALEYQANGFFSNALENAIDLKILESARPLDAIMSHYTDVATIGLFAGLLIFSVKPCAVTHPTIIGVIVGTTLFSVAVVYALLMLKFGFAFLKKSKSVYLMTMLAVFIVDSAAISMFIAAVPESAFTLTTQLCRG